MRAAHAAARLWLGRDEGIDDGARLVEAEIVFARGEPPDATALRRAELKLQDELRKRRPFATVSSEVVTTARGAAVVVNVRSNRAEGEAARPGAITSHWI